MGFWRTIESDCDILYIQHLSGWLNDTIPLIHVSAGLQARRAAGTHCISTRYHFNLASLH